MQDKQIIDWKLETLFSKYGNLDRWPVDFTLYTDKVERDKLLSLDTLPLLVSGSLGISLIGILETLISARIADGYAKEHTDARRETLGLMLGNLASGLMGGIPATAALARTSLNLRSGATSRVSGVISSIAVAGISILALPAFSYIPMCVIAAILMLVALRMIDYADLWHMLRLDPSMFSLCLFTAALCIFTDTTTGMMIGAVIALLLVTDAVSVGHADISFLSKSGHASADAPTINQIDRTSSDLPNLIDHAIHPNHHNDAHESFDDTLVYRITGNLTYVNSLAHVARLERLSSTHYQHVILSLRFVHFIDLDGALALKQMAAILRQQQIEVLVSGASKMVRKQLQKHEFYQQLFREGHVFKVYSDALNYLHLRKKDGRPLDVHQVATEQH
jgi:sulfate permease, SulP family